MSHYGPRHIRVAEGILRQSRRWMSVRPHHEVGQSATPEHNSTTRKKVTIQSLTQQSKSIPRKPITMLTAYDFPTGRACETYGIDITLVGDSLAQVCLGYDSTTRLTMSEMIHHCRAVSRGCKTPLLVADMPFGSYHTGTEEAIRNAIALVRDGGVEGVKIEGGLEVVDTVKKLTTMGIPVMAHVGLLPQRHTSTSGYRVQGKTASSARGVLHSALALQSAGAFSILLEAIPHVLASYITSKVSVPTIGIGAGPGPDGQVLVWDDAMSTWEGHKAKFVRRFADVKGEVGRGVSGFIGAVRDGSFPDPKKESYDIDTGEWEAFLKLEADEGWKEEGQ